MHSRWLVLLCLLAFQAQVLAGAWLPCRHVTPPPDVAACPMHGSGQATPSGIDGQQLFNCAKCALAVAIAVVHGLPSAIALLTFSAGSDHPASLAEFYDQIFPERTAPPPRHLIV